MNAPDKTDSLKIKPDTIPDELRDRAKWICWRYEGKDKVPTSPCNPDAGIISVLDPANWSEFETARRAVIDHRRIEGIGYVFNTDAPIMGVDLDHCRVPETGTIQPWAMDVIDALDSYTEVSPSGAGVHAYVVADLPDGGNRADDIEMYAGKRFFTVTGHHVDGTPTSINDAQRAVDDVHAEWIADREEDETQARDPQTSPSEGLSLTDTELIEKAKTAQTGEQFRRVWNGDYSHQPSHSEARLELYNYLAFWTGKDPQRMWRLFRQSGLYPHPEGPGKCERLKNREIQKAIQDTNNCYDPEWYGNDNKLPKDSQSVTADGGRMDVSDATVVAVVEALEELGEVCASQLAEHPAIDCSERQVRRALDYLDKAGTVEWVRNGRSTLVKLAKADDV